MRTNMLIGRFCRCSTGIKRILFKSYCLCFYDIALWKLFGFSRSDSMSGILMQLSPPSFDTIIHNSRVLFVSHCFLSANCVTDTVHLCSFSYFFLQAFKLLF